MTKDELREVLSRPMDHRFGVVARKLRELVDSERVDIHSSSREVPVCELIDIYSARVRALQLGRNHVGLDDLVEFLLGYEGPDLRIVGITGANRTGVLFVDGDRLLRACIAIER